MPDLLTRGTPGGAPTVAAHPVATRTRAPRWGDGRFLLGLALVLASVVLTTRLVASADDSTAVWALARDLPAGATLTAEDLVVTRVSLAAGLDRYIGTGGEAPSGRVLARPAAAGELLAVAALTDPAAASQRRLVTVPVDPLHLPPDLARGERVDVFVTPGADRASGGQPPSLVLPAATVASVAEPGSGLGAGQVGVVLEVAEDQTAAAVAALRAGPVDLVRIPSR